MKGQLIFRIFVDISSYPYEFFVLRDSILMDIHICCLTFICLIMANYETKHAGDMIMSTKVYIS